MPEFVGDLRAPEGRYGIVAGKFNMNVVQALVEGAKAGLRQLGASESNIDVVYVPGSLEIPLVCRRLAESGRYVALISAGAVIRGETTHYDIVAAESAKGIANLTVGLEIPIINAILTTDTVEQAMNRAGGKMGNKGYEAAMAAVEMANLLTQLPGGAG